MRRVHARLLDPGGRADRVTWDEVGDRLAAGSTFWLDLLEYDDADLTELARLFHFHPLAIEDTRRFHQRAKLDPYDGFALVVAFGAADLETVCEVHAYVTDHAVITVRHQGRCPSLDEVFASSAAADDVAVGARRVLYRVLHELYLSLEPVLEHVDERLNAIEEGVFARPRPEYLREITSIKRWTSRLRQAVVPHRDTFAGGSLALERIPGASTETERYFRDLYDVLVHVSELIESEREHAGNVMDVYLSLVNNHQNEAMRQLSVVATVFLPLAFITGFFGMNFGWMVRRVAAPGAFVALGIGLNVAAAVGIVVLLRRRQLA